MESSSTIKSLIRFSILLLIGCFLLLVAFSPQTIGLRTHYLPDLKEPPALVPRDLFYGLTRSTGNTTWLVGNEGKILVSNDAGQSWSLQPSPTDVGLRDVAAWDSERLLVVGNKGTVLRTETGGDSWTEAENAYSDSINQQGINQLFRVSILKDGHAWAVGQWNMIMQSRDYGQNWTRITKDKDVNLYAVEAITPKRVVGVGEFGKILLGTRNETENWTWKSVESPVDASLKAVEFRNDRRGVAVGLKGTILRTGDGGSSWTLVSRPTSSHFYNVVWTGDRWFAVAGDGRYGVESPNGQEWDVARLAPDEFSWHADAVTLDDQTMLLVGDNLGTFNLSNQKWSLLSR